MAHRGYAKHRPAAQEAGPTSRIGFAVQMLGNEILLICDIPSWSGEIEVYVRQAVRRPIECCRLEAADPDLWSDALGTLILACCRPEEACRVRGLVQELCLRSE